MVNKVESHNLSFYKFYSEVIHKFVQIMLYENAFCFSIGFKSVYPSKKFR